QTRNKPVPAPISSPHTTPRPNPNSVGSTLAAPPGEWSQRTKDGARRPIAAPTIPPAAPDARVQDITATIACGNRIIGGLLPSLLGEVAPAALAVPQALVLIVNSCCWA